MSLKIWHTCKSCDDGNLTWICGFTPRSLAGAWDGLGLWFKDFVLCTINNPQRNGQGVTRVGLLHDGREIRSQRWWKVRRLVAVMGSAEKTRTKQGNKSGLGSTQKSSQETKLRQQPGSMTAGDRNGETIRSGRTPSIVETETHFWNWNPFLSLTRAPRPVSRWCEWRPWVRLVRVIKTFWCPR